MFGLETNYSTGKILFETLQRRKKSLESFCWMKLLS